MRRIDPQRVGLRQRLLRLRRRVRLRGRRLRGRRELTCPSRTLVAYQGGGGEVLSTAPSPLEPLLPWKLVALYGGGALLCRELAQRWGARDAGGRPHPGSPTARPGSILRVSRATAGYAEAVRSVASPH
ncbi:hypothetical protein AB0J35_25055 [Nonomuraea angiospora]|uniref:hypothetical protein n=1 Tax=Nonomuraea angiospora TaxID=46172 RepID=UPI003422993F